MTTKYATLLLVACSLCFGSGWLVGRSRSAPERQQQPTTESSNKDPEAMIASQIAETSLISSVIVQLDQGKIEDAQNLLRLRQDGNILLLNELLPWVSE